MLKQASFIAFYVPRHSFLHRLHVTAKLFILLTYVATVFATNTPAKLLGLCILITTATLLLGLPLRNRVILFVAILMLFGVAFWASSSTIGVRLVVAFGKIVCLMMILALFTMTTKLNEVLLFIRPSSSIMRTLHPLIYIVSITLAVLPSIQYDLQRAIDAETIRRGRRVRLYSVGSWVAIVIVVLVRALARAERLADAVIDRGYLPSKGLVPVGYRPLQLQDIIMAALSIMPGLIVLILLP
jgi:energy-coupling factor transporter transmembrane protein EcfT